MRAEAMQGERGEAVRVPAARYVPNHFPGHGQATPKRMAKMRESGRRCLKAKPLAQASHVFCNGCTRARRVNTARGHAQVE